jgi:hypothetical protein
MRYVFFFSYARTNRDEYLIRFYKDLSRQVEQRLGLTKEELEQKQIGFLDERDLELGSEWEPDLIEALQNSSVLVCAYSPSYFVSEYCGREWHLFQMRRREWPEFRAGLKPMPAAIKPIIWVSPTRRMTADTVHADVWGVQYKLGQTDAIYNTEGIEPMLRRSNTYRDQYEAFIDELAKTIIDASDVLPALPILGPPVPRLSDIAPLFPLRGSVKALVPQPAADTAFTQQRTPLIFATLLLDMEETGVAELQTWRPFGVGTPCTDFMVQAIGERDLNVSCSVEHVTTLADLSQLAESASVHYQALVVLTDLHSATLLAKDRTNLKGFPVFVLSKEAAPAAGQTNASTHEELRTTLVDQVPRLLSKSRSEVHIQLRSAFDKPIISASSQTKAKQ